MDELHVTEGSLEFLPLPEILGGGQSESLRYVRSPSGDNLLYKKYYPEILRPESGEQLRRLARWRLGLAESERINLDARAAWVRQIVTVDGGLAGVLIGPAPDAFWISDRAGKPIPRTSSELTTPGHRALKYETEYFDIPQTVARLGHLLETLNFLHQRELTIGDLTRANVLISRLGTVPVTFLVDCDATLLDGKWTLKRAEAELMRPDDGPWPTVLTRRTDLYKFALLALGAIGKDGAALEVGPDVEAYLSASHSAFLRQLLDMSRATPNTQYIESVVRIWRGYIGTDGGEYIRTPADLKKRPWEGQASITSIRSHTTGPLKKAPSRPAVVPSPPAQRVNTTNQAPSRPARTAFPGNGQTPANRKTTTPAPNKGLNPVAIGIVLLLIAIAIIVVGVVESRQ